MIKKTKKDHRFLDEAGDTTFFGKGKINIIGTTGVSKAFYMGMVKIKGNLEILRQEIEKLEKQIENNEKFKNIPSVKKRVNKFGKFFFHSKDDLPEIKEIFFDFLKEQKFSCEVIIARKKMNIFKNTHLEKDELFYADILGHLLKNKFGNEEKIILNIAKRGNSTKMKNLEKAKDRAKERALANSKGKIIFPNKKVLFEVKESNKDPILSIPDYMLWAVQRLCEKGEIKYYNKVKEKYPVIIDIYDDKNYKKYRNYYNNKPGKFLTENNFIQ